MIVVVTLAGCGPPELETAAQADVGPSQDDSTLVLRHLLTGELVAERAIELLTPDANQWPIQIRHLGENGAWVEAGDTVAEFDNAALLANLDQREAAVVQAQSELLSAQAQGAVQVEEAQLEVTRKSATRDKAALEAAVPRDLRSERIADQHELALNKAELELAEAQATLVARREATAAEENVKRLQVEKAYRVYRETIETLDRLVIEAPQSGFLEITENRREDRPFQAGDQSFPGQSVARIPDLSSLIVRARLFDVDDGAIAPGQPVTVTLDAYPERTFDGRIRAIQPVAQEEGRSLRRSFDVLVDLASIDENVMRTGMSAKVIVERAVELEPGVETVERRRLEPIPGGLDRARLGNREVVVLDCDAQRCAVRAAQATGSGSDRETENVASGLGEQLAPPQQGARS